MATPTATASVAAPTVSVSPTSPVAGGSGSLAYIKDNNVWLAAPDGSGARALTTDGTATAGYHDPSQAPDGSVFALKGPKTLVHLARSGGEIGQPATLNTLENGAEGLTVAPDGAHLAYVTTGYGQYVDPRFGSPSGAFIYGGTDVATPNGQSVQGDAAATLIFPAWVGPQDLLATDGTDLYLYRMGRDPVRWVTFGDGCLLETLCEPGQEAAANVSHPQVSADGRTIAYTYQPYFGDGGRRVGSVDAEVGTQPTTRCLIPGEQNVSDPGTFATHASTFWSDDTSFDPDTLESTVGRGIWRVKVNLGASDCGASGATLVIPGGQQPDWSPLAP